MSMCAVASSAPSLQDLRGDGAGSDDVETLAGVIQCSWNRGRSVSCGEESEQPEVAASQPSRVVLTELRGGSQGILCSHRSQNTSPSAHGLASAVPGKSIVLALGEEVPHAAAPCESPPDKIAKQPGDLLDPASPLMSFDMAAAQQAVETLRALVRQLAQAKIAAGLSPEWTTDPQVGPSAAAAAIRLEVARAMAFGGLAPLGPGSGATSQVRSVSPDDSGLPAFRGIGALPSSGVAPQTASTVPAAAREQAPQHVLAHSSSVGSLKAPPSFARPLYCMSSAAAGKVPLTSSPSNVSGALDQQIDSPRAAPWQELEPDSRGASKESSGKPPEPVAASDADDMRSELSKASKTSKASTFFPPMFRQRTQKYSGRFRVSHVQDIEPSRRAFIGSRSSLAPLAAMFGAVSVAFSDQDMMQSNRWARRVVGSAGFRIFTFCAIMANALMIGIETQTAASGERPAVFQRMNLCFNVAFIFELAMRLNAERLEFIRGDEKWANILDVLLLGLGIASDVAVLVSNSALEGGSALKVARLFRIIRTVRILRTVKSVREFQKMLYALMSSTRTLLCSLLILFSVMYVFAVLLCQAVSDLVVQRSMFLGEDVDPALLEYWGDLSRSFFSLFMAITSGISWELCFRPLSELGWIYSALFIAYVVLCLFGVMNVVTSVFVESAIMSAQHYKHLIIQEKANEREIATKHMKQVFRQIDEDGSGEITAEEMEEFLQDGGLRKYIEALDINAENARMLFRLLDRDGSNKVDIDEFCEGCLRLQGDAKSFDVHAMMYQMKGFLSKWSDFTIYVEERFYNLGAALGIPEAQLRDLSLRSSNMTGRGTGSSMARPTTRCTLVKTPTQSSLIPQRGLLPTAEEVPADEQDESSPSSI